MSTLGQKPATQHVSLQKQTITGNGGTSYSLQQSVGSALDIAVFVNNTRQEPTVAYSATGTTLTMTGNVNASDNFYVIFLGKAITTTGLPVDGVGTANINASAITNAKIANSTIDLTSKVTGVLPAANSQTNAPSFKAYRNSSQSQTQNTVTQIIYNTEIYDSNNTYDTSTGRFTPAVVGKYFVNASVGIDGADANGRLRIYIYKNGSNYAFSSFGIGDTADDGGVAQCSAIVELDADDYVDARIEYTGTDNIVGQQAKTWFEAFKLIGI